MIFEQEKVLNFYRKLIAFYPRDFRERFGESMEQIFNDLCHERRQQNKQLTTGFYLWMFLETLIGVITENLAEIKRGKFMENIISNQKTASLIGFILALPLALILLIAVMNIEPLNSYLKALTTTADGYQLSAFGKIFLITVILLLPIGFIISLVPLVKNVRNGIGIMSSPLILVVAAGLFIFIARLVIGFIIDQYPCWMGVANCD